MFAMARKYILAAIGGAAILLLTAGCKRQPSAEPPAAALPAGYFKTPFQEESQFIVEAIVSDLAEQMFYAASHKLPDTNYFQVTATEKPGSPRDTPVYELQVRLDPKQTTLNSEVDINGPIWSPAVYEGVVKALAQQVGLTASEPGTSTDTSLLSKLTDGSPETIEQENEDLSTALEKDFQNPGLHEEAAALLGAFLMRDHSDYFHEIRSPLCRLTAHLAMAQFLNGTNAYGINGQMAEAMMLTLVNDETPALEKLNAIGTNDATIAPMVRALWTRNTGDYRLLGTMNNLSPVEAVEWFGAWTEQVSIDVAWTKLSDDQQRTIDFVRIANENYYSVEIGHQLLRTAIPLESREADTIYEMSHHTPLQREMFVNALNEKPERCFSTAPDGSVHVCVIGWGQWADFLQRQLCQAIQQNYYFLENIWAVPDYAKDFSTKADREFGKLWLYPFVQRFTFTSVNEYHESVDDGFKVTVTAPQLTPADCWNWICFQSRDAGWYRPNPSPHVNEWHFHNPPPGTVYDLAPRLDHPSLTDRPDAVARFETLHQLAPYNSAIINFIFDKKYHGHPTYDEAVNLYKDILPYNLSAMHAVAKTVYDQPQQYEKLMLQAAQLDSTCYYTLGDYALNRHEEDKAAEYYDKGCDADPDADRATDYAPWRVKYYVKKGNIEKAHGIAQTSGEVYSYYGLEAEGTFFELTTNYDEAYQWYYKIGKRYGDYSTLAMFCTRYKTLTGNPRFDEITQKYEQALFPKGLEKAGLSDFHGAPPDGVLIRQQNELVVSAGLKKGDVIVAIGGTRVHNFTQYAFLCDTEVNPALDLIVWQGSSYNEIFAFVPDHRFGVDFGDYP